MAYVTQSCDATTDDQLNDVKGEESRLRWYSLASGRLKRRVTLRRGHVDDRSLLAPSPSGLLVIAGDFLYRVNGSTVHALPAPSDPEYLDWSAAW